MIRIAAVGDVHFAADAAGSLRPELDRVHEDADVLLLAGDLTRLGLPEEAEVLVEELSGVQVPVVAVLLGVLLLDETFTTAQAAGSVLVVVGLFLVNRRRVSPAPVGARSVHEHQQASDGGHP